jgi:hypothetical protein
LDSSTQNDPTSYGPIASSFSLEESSVNILLKLKPGPFPSSIGTVFDSACSAPKLLISRLEFSHESAENWREAERRLPSHTFSSTFGPLMGQIKETYAICGRCPRLISSQNSNQHRSRNTAFSQQVRRETSSTDFQAGTFNHVLKCRTRYEAVHENAKAFHDKCENSNTK